MNRPRIVLTGLGPRLQGLTWEGDHHLRIGRQDNLDIFIADNSVERKHAEVVHHDQRWLVRDLANNPRHPTLLNGRAVDRDGLPLQEEDVIQCGNMRWQVTTLEGNLVVEEPPAQGEEARNRNGDLVAGPAFLGDPIKTSRGILRVEAATTLSWDEALEKAAFHREARPKQGQGLLTLLRTGYHLRHIASLDELLHSILGDTISSLNAQRGSIVLADPKTGEVSLRAQLAPRLPHSSHFSFSKTLTQRCFSQGESLLCCDVNADVDLRQARSVLASPMSSVICALLRSPRKRLGVLQLDRGLGQEPFTENDLYLADAIAASVAVAIESAQLVEEQQEQFIQTVTCLARAVEVRDQYTGDHTKRVRDYSLILADELKVSAAQRYEIRIGTPLHDIGKIAIDDAILRKQGKLTPGEFEFMKSHTVKGADLLQSMYNLASVIPIVRHHHEKWDGSGYPDGLAGEHIALTARIVSVADAFDAMTSDRPYRKAISPQAAYRELHRLAGTQFDPQCIQAFLKQQELVETRWREEPTS